MTKGSGDDGKTGVREVVMKGMLQNALYWLHECCMGFVLGGSRRPKPCVFPCEVAAGGDERYLVCAAGAAGVVSCANWFLLGVLQRVAVPVCVVPCVS